MSGPSNVQGPIDPKAWLRELKSSRRTQAALVVLALVLGYLLWPESPKARPRAAAANRTVATPLDPRQLESLQKLRDLARLDRAGELPTEGRMYRDLFLFETPPPPPPPPRPVKPPPPPPPLTPEEIEAARLAQARQEAFNSRPQALHYLGYMGRASTGRIASFSKGEDIISLRVGETAGPGWKLVAITDGWAEFQHLKFPDIRFRSNAKDSQNQPASSPKNEF